MTERRVRSRACVVAGGVAVLAGLVPLAAAGSAGAAGVPKPSASCKVPVFSVSPLKAKPGTKVTVSGVNFSGCTAQGSTAKPTPVLTVKIGVQTASKMGAVLATTKTTAAGKFSVTVTVPALTTGGIAKLALAAEATDPSTKLSYAGVAVLAYDVATPTATGSAPVSAAPTSPPGGGVPTAVPAGNGGQAAAAGAGTRDAQFALGGAGALLAAAGAVGVSRRRGQHQ